MKSSERNDFSELEGNHMIRTNEVVTLYHGSKSGIRGAIAPISRTLRFWKRFLYGN